MSSRNSPGREEARHRALSDGTRRRIVRILEDLAEPTGVGALAGLLGLHPNTVRSHLEVLHEAGLVTRSVESRSVPGRPKLLYLRATEEPERGGYRFLAEVLATSLQLASDDASRLAEEAGRVWGRYLTEAVAPNQRLSHQEVVSRISLMLADFGFDPHSEPTDSRTTIDLCDCPFRDLARDQPDVVCAMHLGLLEGSAEALGGSTSVESLQPFVEPSLCRTVLTTDT